MGLNDWDWRNNIQPAITNEKYYSPPYSIRAPSEGQSVYGFCKAPGTEKITNGRVEFVYNHNNTEWDESFGYLIGYIWFRAALALGSTTLPNDCYRVYIDLPAFQVVLVRDYHGSVAGSYRHGIYTDVWSQLDPLTWNWFRVTWWSVPDVGLVVRYEVKINNTWYKICGDFVGIPDYYSGYTYNRVGFAFTWVSGSNPPHIDNIKIYKAI